MGPRRAARLGGGLLVVALIALVGWPLSRVAQRFIEEASAGQAPDHGVAAARQAVLALETFRLIALTAAIALPIGVALALLLERVRFAGRGVVRLVFLIGLFVPISLQAVFWLGAFGNQGRSQALGDGPALVGLSGAAFVHAMATLPWVILIVGSGLRSVEPELEELALLDMPAWRVLLSVTLKRAYGSVIVAALAIAVLTGADMTVADLIPLRTYAEEAYTLAQSGMGLATLAARSSLPQLLLFCFFVPFAAARAARTDLARIATARVPDRALSVGRGAIVAAACAWFTASIYAGLPLYGLFWRAGRTVKIQEGAPLTSWSLDSLYGSLRGAWADIGPSSGRLGLDFGTLINSTLWAGLAALVATSLAWGLAWRSRMSRGFRVLAWGTVAILLATPAPIVGIVLKLAYSELTLLVETPALLILGLVARTLPYCLLGVWPAVHAVPRATVEMVELEGASAAWHFGLPSTWPAVVVAWLLALALGLGELPTSYFLYAPGYEPLSVRIWGLLHVGVESRLAAISLIVLGVLVCIGAGAGLARRRWA